MSAPGIGKKTNVSLLDWSTVDQLPKPIKAVVYLILLSVLTVAGIGALLATIVIIGQVTGSFDLSAFLR